MCGRCIKGFAPYTPTHDNPRHDRTVTHKVIARATAGPQPPRAFFGKGAEDAWARAAQWVIDHPGAEILAELVAIDAPYKILRKGTI